MTFKSRYWEQDEKDRATGDGFGSSFGGQFTGSFLNNDNFLDSARGYRANSSGTITPILPGQGVFSTTGTKNVFGAELQANDAEMAFAADSLNQEAELIAAKELAAGQRSSARSQASGARTGSIIGAVGSVGGAIAGALI